MATEPESVMILVRNAGQVCMLPACQDQAKSCPELEEETEYLREWNWQSQRCVRGLIKELGGRATDERFWLVNALVASLTWPQIQQIGAHPDVQYVESSESGTPPP